MPMTNTSPEIDAYIAKAAPFARPILQRIRKQFHVACPEIVETIKWGMPSFERFGIVGGMAAFKSHVAWGFWKQRLLHDPKRYLAPVGDETSRRAKVTRVADLPPDKALREFVRHAVLLNENGVKLPRRARAKRPPPEVPADLAAALKKHARARAAFGAFPPSHKREYVEWLTEAKREETRAKRLATAIEWIAAGKPRNWKYMGKC